MGASYGKLSPEHEEAIYLLRKAGESGASIRRALASGSYRLPASETALAPVSISANTANRIGRRILDEREELYSSEVRSRATPEAIKLLTRRLMMVAEREVLRLERGQRVGRLDANKLGKLAGALERLQRLQERIDADPPLPKGANDVGSPDDGDGSAAQRDSFAASLVADHDQAGPQTPPTGTGDEAVPIADVKRPGAPAAQSAPAPVG